MLFCYSIFFLCLIATRCVWAGWDGYPALEMKHDEHEFLAACREGNMPAIEFYLAQPDFDVNTRWPSGISGKPTTGMYVAAYSGHIDVIHRLIESGADPRKGMLRWWGTVNMKPITAAKFFNPVQQIGNYQSVSRQSFEDIISTLKLAESSWGYK